MNVKRCFPFPGGDRRRRTLHSKENLQGLIKDHVTQFDDWPNHYFSIANLEKNKEKNSSIAQSNNTFWCVLLGRPRTQDNGGKEGLPGLFRFVSPPNWCRKYIYRTDVEIIILGWKGDYSIYPVPSNHLFFFIIIFLKSKYIRYNGGEAFQS